MIPRRWALSRLREASSSSFRRRIVVVSFDNNRCSCGEYGHVDREVLLAPNKRLQSGSVISEVSCTRGVLLVLLGGSDGRLCEDEVLISVSGGGSSGSSGMEPVSIGNILGDSPELVDASLGDAGVGIMDVSDDSFDEGFSIEVVGFAGCIEGSGLKHTDEGVLWDIDCSLWEISWEIGWGDGWHITLYEEDYGRSSSLSALLRRRVTWFRCSSAGKYRIPT